MAKAAGVPVFLDAGGMEGPLSPGLLSCLTVLSPNETELARMTNMPTDTIEQVEVWRGCGWVQAAAPHTLSLTCALACMPRQLLPTLYLLP